MTSGRSVDAITDDLRARLGSIASELERLSQGHGRWSDADQVCLDLTICRDRLIIVIDEMVKHLVKVRP